MWIIDRWGNLPHADCESEKELLLSFGLGGSRTYVIHADRDQLLLSLQPCLKMISESRKACIGFRRLCNLVKRSSVGPLLSPLAFLLICSRMLHQTWEHNALNIMLERS